MELLFCLPFKSKCFLYIISTLRFVEGSRDTGYLPFYFQGCRILFILLPGIWNTLFNFRDTAIFPTKIQIQSRNTNNINKNYFKFSAKEERCMYMTWQVYLDLDL